MIVLLASVSQLGEAVDVDAIAFTALENLHEPALAHARIKLHDGAAECLGLGGIALLVDVEHQFVGRYLHGQYVIGNPLIEQIVGRRIGFLGSETVAGRVLAVVEHPLLHIIGRDVARLLADGFPPEVVLLGKEREAIQAVLGCKGHLIACGAMEHPSVLRGIIVGYLTGLVEVFIAFIAQLAQRIQQSAGSHHLGSHKKAFAFLVDDAFDEDRHIEILGSNHLLHAMDDAVDGGDVSVPHAHGAVEIEIDGVGIIAIAAGELAVVEVGERKLAVVFLGEVPGRVGGDVSSIDDAAIHHHAAHRIEFVLVGEGIP